VSTTVSVVDVTRASGPVDDDLVADADLGEQPLDAVVVADVHTSV
jgi:hypothetical protein